MCNIVIFGAQAIALGTYKAIKKLYPEKKVISFLVSKRELNSYELGGLDVEEIDSFSRSLSTTAKEEIEVWIATPEFVMAEIELLLIEHGFYNYKRVTSDSFAELMKAYFADGEYFVPLSLLLSDVKKTRNPQEKVKVKDNIQVFMAKFYRDKPLTGIYHIPEWMIPIQAGAALCEECVAEISDYEGENISYKNVNYSELTVLYWIWKNKLENTDDDWKYYGLAHYRRMLDVSEEDISRLLNNDVDVVLPYPMPYEPNIHAHHERYLKEEDWNALLQAIDELQPEYAKLFPKILTQEYMFNYNIVLAKKEVLREYCSWLFPILERTEELSVPKGCDRADRYIGYMGETLTTLYFMVNKEKLRIVYTGCRFLI